MLTDADVEKRALLVREAKVRKRERGLGWDLTPAELDEVLPPVPCARTRDRLEGRGGRDERWTKD